MIQDEKEYYTVPEVKRILKVSTQTVLKYLKNRELKGFRLGNQWRVSKKGLENFIDRNSNEREIID
jgi:excisionase family DNA binding protein